MRKRCRGGCCIETALEGNKFCGECLAKAQEKFQGYQRLYEESRKESNAQFKKFYNSKEWKDKRNEILGKSPICQECSKAFASEVHHLIPLKVNWALRLNNENLKAWCKPCHSKYELGKRQREKEL